MKSYTAKEIVAILIAHGFELRRTTGSHQNIPEQGYRENDGSAYACKRFEKGYIT